MPPVGCFWICDLIVFLLSVKTIEYLLNRIFFVVILLSTQNFPCAFYRLFTTVRDSLGLTYDVSFELNLFDRLKLGWYVISVTSPPGKVRVQFPCIYFQ